MFGNIVWAASKLNTTSQTVEKFPEKWQNWIKSGKLENQKYNSRNPKDVGKSLARRIKLVPGKRKIAALGRN